MKRIAIFLADGFEEVEALSPIDLLRRAGYEVTTVSIKDASEKDPLTVTASHDVKFIADKLIGELDFDAQDMIILPGGMPGTTNLEACEELKKHITEFDEKKKWICAICAAPGILGRMGLLKGRKAVAFPTCEDGLIGAEIPHVEVAVDGHFITSRGMGTAIPFALKIIEMLSDKAKADAMAECVVYEVYRD